MSEEQLVKFYDKLSEVSERTARIEAMLASQVMESQRLGALLDNHEARLAALEKNNERYFGVREFIVWAIAVSISIAGVMWK